MVLPILLFNLILVLRAWIWQVAASFCTNEKQGDNEMFEVVWFVIERPFMLRAKNRSYKVEKNETYEL